MPLLHLKLHPILSFFPFAIQFQFYRICAGQFVAGCHKPNQMILASADRPGFFGYILLRGFYTDDAELICRIIVNCPIINQSINELEEKKKTVVEEYDAKITAAKERIKSLEAKKQEILAPKAPRKPRKTKKQKIQEIVKLAMKNGMSVEEVASQLHVEVES